MTSEKFEPSDEVCLHFAIHYAPSMYAGGGEGDAKFGYRQVREGAQREIASLRARLEAMEGGWYDCPNCAFRFSATHRCEDGTYDCPVCSEHALRQRLAAIEALCGEARDRIADLASGPAPSSEETETCYLWMDRFDALAGETKP